MHLVITFAISLETIPWVEIFWGFFLIGIFLSIKSLIMGLHASTDHDVDHDFDHDVDHDFDHDMDHDVDHDFDHDVDHDFDHDIDHLGGGVHGGGVSVVTRGAPLMMLVGSFFLLYGGLGIILFSEPGRVYEKLLGMTFIVVIILFAINTLWSKLFTIETYVLPRRRSLIGFVAIVVHTVDKEGGTIKVDVGLPKGSLLFSAFPKYPDAVYPPGTRVRIIGWRKTFAIVVKS